jgi:hypothetical protein
MGCPALEVNCLAEGQAAGLAAAFPKLGFILFVTFDAEAD